NPKKSRELANERRSKQPRLHAGGPGGREIESSDLSAEINKPIGARPRSEVTGRHDAGSGANETVDGLTSSEEAVRRGAEDVPIKAPKEATDDVPVFERAGTLPKV